MPDEQPLYIGVPDPLDLRKDILNSSKVLISTLKRYEDYNEMRKSKRGYYGDLAKVVKEINLLNKRFKQLMPKAKLKPGMIRQPPRPIAPTVSNIAVRAGADKVPVNEKANAPKELPAPRMIKEKSRLAQLEDELAQVESKLNTLG